MGWPIDMERKGCESIECWTHVVTFNVHLFHDLDLGYSRSNFEKSHISGMGWPIDMERKGCESSECQATGIGKMDRPSNGIGKMGSAKWIGQVMGQRETLTVSNLLANVSRGRRLMHEHVFMHLPAWGPPEAVGKQSSCGQTTDAYRH